MSLIELFLLAVGLSMDAFCDFRLQGSFPCRNCVKHALIIGLYFGGFQALMPWIGYVLGIRFRGQSKPMITGSHSSCSASLVLIW